MVLLERPTAKSGSGFFPGRNQSVIEDSKTFVFEVLFDLCNLCQEKVMSSIPMSAFSAGRIRETQRDMKVSTITNKDTSSKYFNTTFMELSPLKYNSKLMNSIWGFYNRYSPHNVKKVNDANGFSGEMQQSAAVSPAKQDTVLTIPSTPLDKMWAAINVSQSH